MKMEVDEGADDPKEEARYVRCQSIQFLLLGDSANSRTDYYVSSVALPRCMVSINIRIWSILQLRLCVVVCRQILGYIKQQPLYGIVFIF